MVCTSHQEALILSLSDDLMTMNCQVHTSYDPDSEIFFKVYSGDVHLKDIFSSWEKVIKSDSIRSDNKKIVIDYSAANILFPPEGLPAIADFYNNHDAFFGESKIAMVMISPRQVVFPHLMELEDINFSIKVFFTVNAAIRWLLE